MLTYQNYAGRTRIQDSIQIAVDKAHGLKIFYNPQRIKLLEDAEDPCMAISYIVDEEVQRSHTNISAAKLNSLDADIVADDLPNDRTMKRIFNAVKNNMSYQESRTYNPIGADIEVLPSNVEDQTDSIYVSGMKGSGKTYFAAHYAVNYMREFPGNAVYIFTVKDCDKNVDDIPGVIRIQITRQFVKSVSKGLPFKPFINSLMIFDDYEAISDDDLRRGIIKFKDACHKVGRSYGIYVISIQHKGLGGPDSKIDLSESNMIVMFPKKNLAECKKLLKIYCSLSKNQCDNIYRLIEDVRYICILREYNILITNTFIKIIDDT